ncbi:hypothetical protein BKK47_07355 [Rodentibacter mrazii]|uniref:Uncharacterized protein n=1 Tax=Rodentibacter mrazii TaxID=1908257 RepID=A0A1V3IFH6_9PAST|nr:hypothetical protein [Rodentibacter mrazii]OOF39178.1 hypothetical protein BKK47_07355 [Rodentibacter mrazii]
MKRKFKQWLIGLNEEMVNELGIDEIISCLDDDLNIIHGNEEEHKILDNFIHIFEKNKRG